MGPLLSSHDSDAGHGSYSLSAGWPRFGSVRLRFGVGTVRAVRVFGSGGSSAEVLFFCFNRV